MILKYFLHMGMCILCGAISIFMLHLEKFYFTAEHETNLLVAGLVVALGVLLTKYTDQPRRSLFSSQSKRHFLDDYLVSVSIILLVMNAATGGGFSEEPVRLIVLGLMYISIKQLVRANTLRIDVEADHLKNL